MSQKDSCLDCDGNDDFHKQPAAQEEAERAFDCPDHGYECPEEGCGCYERRASYQRAADRAVKNFLLSTTYAEAITRAETYAEAITRAERRGRAEERASWPYESELELVEVIKDLRAENARLREFVGEVSERAHAYWKRRAREVLNVP